MREGIKKYSIAALLLLAAAVSAWVNPEYIAERFNEALSAYRSGDYSAAHSKFTNLNMDSRGSQYYSMTIFMIALSSYDAGNWDATAREFADFAKTFPGHPSAAKARVYQGNSRYKTGNPIPAVEAYLLAMDIASEKDIETAEIARRSARAILWGELTMDQLQIVGENAGGPSSQIVDYIRVLRHEHGGELSRALDICNRSLGRRSKGFYADSLKALSASISAKLTDHLSIAVFAPTSGVYTEYGQNMLNGIRLAIDEYKKESGKKIDLLIENTAADILVGAYAARNVYSTKSPVAAIGPLLSDVAVPVGAFSDEYRIPLVSPTASKDGLAGISPFVFQIATPPSIGAGKLAEYAVSKLWITRFSALAPDDPVGRKAVSYFAEKVESLGGEMVSVSYYAEGTVDFSEHLKHIRQPYYDQMKRFSARADTTDYRFYKPNGTMRDEGEWIIGIPAIFIPAYYEDLINILPQVPFNYIQTRLLGANGWIIDDVKSMDASYIDSAIVVADNFWANTEAAGWDRFSKNYRKAYGSGPDRIAAQGYDAGRIVCAGIASGAITPGQMRDYLSGASDFDGPGGGVTFDASGTNTRVNLIVFDRRTPKIILE